MSDSSQRSTEHVNERIESFLKMFYNKLRKMSDKELERAKHSIIKLKQCADLHLKDEVARNWDEITANDYLFDRLEKEVACIEKLTFSDLRKWMARHIAHGNKANFRKLSCQVSGHTKKSDNVCSKKLASSSLSDCSTTPNVDTQTEKCLTQTLTGASPTLVSSQELLVASGSQFCLQLLSGTDKEANQYITDIEQFKKTLFIYPINNVIS